MQNHYFSAVEMTFLLKNHVDQPRASTGFIWPVQRVTFCDNRSGRLHFNRGKEAEYRNAAEKLSMANYLLSYDLIRRKEYPQLFAELKKMKATRVLLSTWYLADPGLGDAEALRDHFRQFVEADDRIFVGKVTEWAAHNVRSNPVPR